MSGLAAIYLTLMNSIAGIFLCSNIRSTSHRNRCLLFPTGNDSLFRSQMCLRTGDILSPFRWTTGRISLDQRLVQQCESRGNLCYYLSHNEFTLVFDSPYYSTSLLVQMIRHCRNNNIFICLQLGLEYPLSYSIWH